MHTLAILLGLQLVLTALAVPAYFDLLCRVAELESRR
jgi:hypothetical protein